MDIGHTFVWNLEPESVLFAQSFLNLDFLIKGKREKSKVVQATNRDSVP